ncbi:hypothetical protein [Microcystis aeruginosa]|nr:hypothetical protein [Microcystis aeruginosa]
MTHSVQDVLVVILKQLIEEGCQGVGGVVDVVGDEHFARLAYSLF